MGVKLLSFQVSSQAAGQCLPSVSGAVVPTARGAAMNQTHQRISLDHPENYLYPRKVRRHLKQLQHEAQLLI